MLPYRHSFQGKKKLRLWGAFSFINLLFFWLLLKLLLLLKLRHGYVPVILYCVTSVGFIHDPSDEECCYREVVLLLTMGKAKKRKEVSKHAFVATRGVRRTRKGEKDNVTHMHAELLVARERIVQPRANLKKNREMQRRR